MPTTPPRRRRTRRWVLGILLYLGAGCALQGEGDAVLHRWWAGLGPVLPHETFPADCSLCHAGDDWAELVDDFHFDHEAETGVPLRGAHRDARCLRCHNDRGPVASFAARGCAGCHEDVHQAELGPDCSACHDERSWRARGQYALHNRTRLPLTGAHAGVACHRCHPGAFTGDFQPADPECVTCHTADLQRAQNPPHLALGLVDRCDRCHIPIRWNQARSR